MNQHWPTWAGLLQTAVVVGWMLYDGRHRKQSEASARDMIGILWVRVGSLRARLDRIGTAQGEIVRKLEAIESPEGKENESG